MNRHRVALAVKLFGLAFVVLSFVGLAFASGSALAQTYPNRADPHHRAVRGRRRGRRDRAR